MIYVPKSPFLVFRINIFIYIYIYELHNNIIRRNSISVFFDKRIYISILHILYYFSLYIIYIIVLYVICLYKYVYQKTPKWNFGE